MTYVSEPEVCERLELLPVTASTRGGPKLAERKDPRTQDVIMDVLSYCAFRPQNIYNKQLGPAQLLCPRPPYQCPEMVLDRRRVWDILGEK